MTTRGLRIAMRADASADIGLGHVKRCLALASALRECGALVRLVSRDLGIGTVDHARSVGASHVQLASPELGFPTTDIVPHAASAAVDWHQDAAEVIQALTDWNPHWVLVDHYAFDARWHRLVSEKLRARIAVIDDLADRDIAAEMLVDPSISADHRGKFKGRLRADIRILGGPRYALLAPAYRKLREFQVEPAVRSIGIFMGGTDALNFSAIALRACRQVVQFPGPIEIATTSGNPNLVALQMLARRWSDTTVVVDLPDLVSFFARHDLQIGAGGGASWERCAVGVPTLALIVAANQRAVLPDLSKLGAVALVDGAPLVDDDAVASALRPLLSDPIRRTDLSRRCRTVVDGVGATRVALAMVGASMTARPAESKDAAMMYEWRNHPSTRKMSRDAKELRREDHSRWLDSVLLDPMCVLLIGCVGRTDIGVVRFDIRESTIAEVSVYLDPTLYGLKLGPLLLEQGERYLLTHKNQVRLLTAEILPGNTTSQKLFESSGYAFEGGQWRKRLQR